MFFFFFSDRAQKSKEHDNTDPLSVDNHASVSEWIARKDLCSDDHGSSDWMAIELPSPSKMRLKSSMDEVEELSDGMATRLQDHNF